MTGYFGGMTGGSGLGPVWAGGQWTLSVQVAFNDTVWASSPTWTDITKYVTKVTTSMGRQHELQQVNPSTAIIELTNQPVSTTDPGGRFSPWNTASPFYYSGSGLTPGHPVRIQATMFHSATVYNVFYGYTQSWVPKYGQSTSDVTLNCYDGMALLNLAMMDKNLYEAQVLTDGATAYWECQDPVGSRTLADATGNLHTSFLWGSGVLGGTAGALRAVADSCLTLGSGTNLGAGLLFSPIGTAATSHVMFDGWFQTQGTHQYLMSWDTNPFVVNGFNQLWINATGFPEIAQGTIGGSTGFITGPNKTNDGNWHHYAVEVPCTDSTGTYTLYVDGILIGSFATASVSSGQWTGSYYFLAGGFWASTGGGPVQPYPALTGAMDQVAYYQTPLSAAQVLNHYQLGSAGFVVQDSGARTQAVLEDLVGVPSGLVNVDTGVVQLQGATSALNQTTASSYLQQVTNTERGLLYQDTTGVFQFKNRWHVYTNSTSVNSQFSFTYHGGGQYYLSTGLVPGEDDTDLWNDVNVGRQGGVIQNASDSTSITNYGRRSLQGYTSLLFENDSDAQDLAQGLLSQYSKPAPRVRAIQSSSTIQNAAALPAILALNLLDRITIVWKPIDGSSSDFSQQSLVEQVQHTIVPGQWDTTLAVTPIGTEVFGLWGSAEWGVAPGWGF